jgi:hypothetical protein
MKNKIRKILTLIFLTFPIVSCSQNNPTEVMEWLTTETEYEGNPLYLRLPSYKNIWQYKSKFPKLMCITHIFDSVKDNGLPTADYNISLIDFDGEVVSLLESSKNGIVFLVETYGGARNYWFYVLDSEYYSKIFEDLQTKYPEKKLELDYRNDSDWGFIKDYPFELYKSE